MDDNGDSGWIKGLPAGWIDGTVCARRLFAKLKAECVELDPAPWRKVEESEYWAKVFQTAADDYLRNQKLAARLEAVFQRAVCDEQLIPSWFDGTEFRRIPIHAFSNPRVVHNALLLGQYEVDPLWPDDWQTLSGHGWAISKDQFQSWLAGDTALSMIGLPVAEGEWPACDVARISSRSPSAVSRVPMSEAVTWIAFGIALDAERLARAISWDSIADGDLQAAQRQMEVATTTLLQAAADGLVPMFGRHMEAHGEKGTRTEQINPLTLEDYRKAWIVGQDSLHYGTGLFGWYRAPNDCLLSGSERTDHFTNVTVEREALLKHCGARLDALTAPLMPIPAALPDVGEVLGLEEATCLVAYGRPSHDIELWMDQAGQMILQDRSGSPLSAVDGDELPPHLVTFINANQLLWGPLQDGTLRALIAPREGPVLAVPRIYWNSIAPERLPSTYQGTSKSDAGRGCPILLSRQEFSAWREAITRMNVETSRYPGGLTWVDVEYDPLIRRMLRSAQGGTPPNRQLKHEEIIQQAEGLRTMRPGISIGSAAASIVEDLPRNPKTGKRRDTRHIERIIANLWEGEVPESPP